MDANNRIADLLAAKLNGKVVVSTDIAFSEIKETEIDDLSDKILAFFEGKPGVLTNDTLTQIKKELEEKQQAEQINAIEVSRSSEYKPLAKEYEGNFRIRNLAADKTLGTTGAFSEYFDDRFKKLSDFLRGNGRQTAGAIGNLEAMKQYATGKELSVVGMVYDKVVTKNGNVMVTIDDQSGSAKILFMKPQSKYDKKQNELFDMAKHIAYDDVLAIHGKMFNQFLIATSLALPDIPIRPKKLAEVDLALAMTSDIHIGSKKFLGKQFEHMIKWLKGEVNYRKDLAGKVKYLSIAGDVADGIGVYPNQDKELEITDLYSQYDALFKLIDEIPDYITVFLLPGNHDGVQKAEPQPPLGDDIVKDFKRDNVKIMSNPAYMNVEGLKVLGYHGSALAGIIRYVPGCSWMKPETAMIELLKRRHLSPIYGGYVIVPSQKDTMVMDDVPDILHSGHAHKNGYAEYHGTVIVNSGTWQDKTSYQIKQGHIPDPCRMPIYEMKSGKLQDIDFNIIGE